MRTIDRRLSNLEQRFGIASNTPRFLLILMDAGQELGPAEEAYIESLDEAGSLPAGGFCVVVLGNDGSRTIASRRTQRL
jgi:hypothetical protein